MRVGDYVRITNPLPQYKGLYKLKNCIGKIKKRAYESPESYNIYFKEIDSTYLFFESEITKISKTEVFMEILWKLVIMY